MQFLPSISNSAVRPLLAVLVSLALALPVGARGGRVAGHQEAGQPMADAPREGYHSEAEILARIDGWVAADDIEAIDLGLTAGGHPLRGVQFGAQGPIPLSDRPTVLLLGGLDGISLAGGEAVLQVTDHLLVRRRILPPEVTIVAIPWANPDGLARRLGAGMGIGRNGRSVDDDRDGQKDEDGPEDLDGDGQVLELLVEDPLGAWFLPEGSRFLRLARAGDAPRYRIAPEGRDDDGDGRFNEDGPGGVVLDRNFPVGWKGRWVREATGPWPLSEPASRALSSLALARKTVSVIVFQGNHGGLAVPGGGSTEGPGLMRALDLPAFDSLHRLLARSAGREQADEAPPPRAQGRAIDWLYAVVGATAVEVAPWGPLVGRTTGVGPREGGMAVGQGGAVPSGGRYPYWERWIEDTRGGLGFVDWQPVEIGPGQRGLVGGWGPRTLFNPPDALLAGALKGLDLFTLQLVQRVPRLQIEVLEARRDGELVELRAEVRNLGGLPVGVGLGTEMPRFRLLPQPGVERIIGAEEIVLPRLPGGAASPEAGWILSAPSGAVLILEVESPWTVKVRQEVRT